MNACSGGIHGAGGPFADRAGGTSLHSLTDPNGVILVVESTAGYNDFNPLLPVVFARTTDKQGFGGHLFSGRHEPSDLPFDDNRSQKSNFLYADGHVKSINPLLTIGPTLDSDNQWTVNNEPFSFEDRKTAQHVLGFAVEAGHR